MKPNEFLICLDAGHGGYFKNLEIEIREMDFDGVPLQEIAARVGLSVPQVLNILDEINDKDIEEETN